MLHKSSLFKMLMTETKKPEVAEEIINLIKKYEDAFSKKRRLQDITKDNYLEILNDSIEFIEQANNIKSWAEDLRLNILRNKNRINKKFELASISAGRAIDMSDTLREVTNKTEKAKLKQLMMKEQLIDIEHELDEARINLESAEMFAKEAISHSELTYAYYQAVKNINTEYIYNNFASEIKE